MLNSTPEILEQDVFGLPAEAYRLRDKVRSFIAENVMPHEDESLIRNIPALDAKCAELRVLAKAEGLYAPDIWAEWKGSGISWRLRHIILEEAGRSYLGAGALHCAPPDLPNMDLLELIATPEQREKYLVPLLRAEGRSCFSMTEPPPGTGSDPSMIQTKAVRNGGKWVLNGRKWFSSGAVGARFALVIALAQSGPSLFAVSTDNPGWRQRRSLNSFDGSQLGGHAEVDLVDCIVEDCDLLGREGGALEYAQMRLEPARLGHCMRMVGRAQRVIEIATSYVNERMSFGKNLGDLQLVQAMIADAYLDLHVSRLLTWHVSARMDAGLSVKQESAYAKVFVSEAVNRVADRAVQLTGAHGTLMEGPIAQFFNEVRPFRIYDGASEVHRAAIGRRIIRESKRFGTFANANG